MSQFYCRENELTALSKEKRIVFVIDEYEKKYLFSSLDKQ